MITLTEAAQEKIKEVLADEDSKARLDDLQEKMMAPIRLKVQSIVKTVATENGYTDYSMAERELEHPAFQVANRL